MKSFKVYISEAKRIKYRFSFQNTPVVQVILNNKNINRMDISVKYIKNSYEAVVSSPLDRKAIIGILDLELSPKYKLGKDWSLDSFSNIEIDKITKSELDQLEKYLDNLFNKAGLDIEFTKHFLKRVNHSRNVEQIDVKELKKMFDAEYKKYASDISTKREKFQAILTDLSSEINIPFILRWDEKKDKMEIISKTIMRTPFFRGSNERFKVKS